MASKSRGSAKLAKPEKDVGPPAKFVQSIVEATGASEEDVKQMLHDCNNDANEATNRLLDGAGTEQRCLSRSPPRSVPNPAMRAQRCLTDAC